MNRRLVGTVVVVGIITTLVWYFGFLGKKAENQVLPVSAQSSVPRVRVVNVLDKALYDDAHIKGSIQIDAGTIESATRDWDKGVTVIVYCSNYMCSASREVAKKLTALGFADVRAYEGGMAEWYERSQKDPSYKIEGAAQESYLRHVMKPSKVKHEGVVTIEAADLKKLLEDAGL